MSDAAQGAVARHAELAGSFDRVDTFTSRSYVSILDDEAREPLLAQVRTLVDGFEQPFPVPYLTHAYLWQRTSAPAS